MIRYKNKGAECSIIEDGWVYDFDVQGNLKGQGRQVVSADMNGMTVMPIISVLDSGDCFYYISDNATGTFHTGLNAVSCTMKVIQSGGLSRSLMAKGMHDNVAFSQMIFVLKPCTNLTELIQCLKEVNG